MVSARYGCAVIAEVKCASCLDPTVGIPSLPELSVDVTITDPPYEVEAHTKGRRTKPKGWRATAPGDGRGVVEAPLPFASITEAERTAVAAELGRVTRRWSLVFCQVEASIAWAQALAAAGLLYVRTMIWVKPDGQPQLTGDRPGMGYESIVVAHRKGRKRWNGGGRLGVFVHSKNSPNMFGAHPTVKPLALMLELVDLFSEPGELVLDPYAGSGSTGVACRQLGRRFLGFEIDAQYAEVAARRLRGEAAMERVGQPDLFGMATP